MRISIIVEGKTETAFIPHLRRYLRTRLEGKMPNLDPLPYNGRIPTEDRLRHIVFTLLDNRHNPADHVIALTDVYTGSQPPDFQDASEAKNRMRAWVGEDPRFHPHAAQHDFEAWLLPYWRDIQRLAGHRRAAPAGNPESVNHNNPPSHHVKEIFRIGTSRGAYVKDRDAARILRDKDLAVAISQCQELKAFINTILSVSGGEIIP